ncbi:MAG: tyrosine--tRNA ligase [Calditrichaeota bacterium]|nr:tyrosine--tRNA ligase [Calditrichota bacterium]
MPPEEQLRILKDAVPPVEIIDEAELLSKLERSFASGKPLRIKQGFDASAPDLHIGHAVSLWKLRAFQDLGHKVIFLIGDFTAMIGDPSGKSKTRPRLSREEVLVNSETYRQQVFRILRDDPEVLEVRFNSEWHAKRDVYQFLELASRRTVARILERDDFMKRFQAQEDISLLEFLYPLVQAYDSVALEADVELGGMDQKFNLVLARQIQRSYGQEPQVLFLMPLLKGLDGNEKMSKSLGNYIGVTDTADDIYGKVMSIPDSLLEEYFVLASGLGSVEARSVVREDPYQAKHRLAHLITARYCGEEAAQKAGEGFRARFKEGKPPEFKELEDQNRVCLCEPGEKVYLPRIMQDFGAVSSGSAAKRLIDSGSVRIDGEKIPVGTYEVVADGHEHIVKVGKRFYFGYAPK